MIILNGESYDEVDAIFVFGKPFSTIKDNPISIALDSLNPIHQRLEDDGSVEYKLFMKQKNIIHASYRLYYGLEELDDLVRV